MSKQPKPCDMGQMCLDCQPRGANGECPDQYPVQEPAAWYDKHGMITHDPFEGVTPLYTEPPKRKEGCAECGKLTSDGWALYCVKCSEPMREWAGLTEEEISAIAKKLFGFPYDAGADRPFARAIEAKLKEKNT